MKKIIIQIIIFYLFNVLIYIILKSIFRSDFEIFTILTLIVPLILIFISQIFAFIDIFLTKKSQKIKTIKTFLIIATTINFSIFIYSDISEWHYNKTKKNIDSNLAYLENNYDKDTKLAIKSILEYFNQSNFYLIKLVGSEQVDTTINEKKLNGTQITIWHQTTYDKQLYKTIYLVLNQKANIVLLNKKVNHDDYLYLDSTKKQVKEAARVLFDSLKIDTRNEAKKITDF